METADIVKAVIAVVAVAGMGIGTNQVNKGEMLRLEELAVQERNEMRSSCMEEKLGMQRTCEAFITMHCGDN